MKAVLDRLPQGIRADHAEAHLRQAAGSIRILDQRRMQGELARIGPVIRVRIIKLGVDRRINDLHQIERQTLRALTKQAVSQI
jgi:hypothetical protein